MLTWTCPVNIMSWKTPWWARQPRTRCVRAHQRVTMPVAMHHVAQGRVNTSAGDLTTGALVSHLGAVEVHVVPEALDLVDRQALVEGQQHLHIVAAL